MAVMKFDVNHSLSKDQARERVQKLMTYWGDKYGVKSEWNGDQASVLGKVMGINLEANFEVRDGQVSGDVDPSRLSLLEHTQGEGLPGSEDGGGRVG